MALNVTAIAHFLLGACVPIHILVWKEKKTAVIMLRMLGAAILNLGTWATWHTRLAHS
jgi:hypothetical protein